MLLQLDFENEENFYSLKSSFEEYAKKINPEDTYNLYTALRSYCVQKVLHSNESFRKEQFDIDRLAIKYEAYSPAKHKYFQIIPFRNYLTVSISAGEFDWAEELINNYLHKLNPKYQSDLLNFSRAAISFMKKDFETSLKYTNLLKGSHIFFKYDIRAYTLMNYYELGMFEPALEHIDSYRHFLNKNISVSKRRRRVVLNFVNLINDIILYRLKSSRKNLSNIKNEINTTSSLSNKTWLLKKISELETE